MLTASPDQRTPRRSLRAAAVALALLLFAGPALAQDAPPAPAKKPSGEANLVLPDLNKATFVGGIGGKDLLYLGLVVSVAGLVFGLVVYNQLKKMAVHRTMLEVSELIYETCKTYLFTQGKFLAILWLFIGAIITLYFGYLTTYTDPVTGVSQHGFPPERVAIILFFSVVGILGSYGVAWFGIRVNTYANSRTAFASLEGKPYSVYAIPIKSGMSVGMLLISVELLIMLIILMFVPGELAGACFIGF
ncbi:MAG TPA: sodium/proton-translocating pyrophosphatase, partial [Urbifossiella sp.]|nr:sodium/proton-translocating pyrophosphatase [Urbifossiella sp.]